MLSRGFAKARDKYLAQCRFYRLPLHNRRGVFLEIFGRGSDKERFCCVSLIPITVISVISGKVFFRLLQQKRVVERGFSRVRKDRCRFPVSLRPLR
jgi:hypothetical protein